MLSSSRASIAFDFLFLALTITCDDYLEGARLVLLANRRGVACLIARVATDPLRLATKMLAVLSGILALSQLMTCFSTGVRAALQSFAANKATDCIFSPAGLILQSLLAA
jgi:hypothetical protein